MNDPTLSPDEGTCVGYKVVVDTGNRKSIYLPARVGTRVTLRVEGVGKTREKTYVVDTGNYFSDSHPMLSMSLDDFSGLNCPSVCFVAGKRFDADSGEDLRESDCTDDWVGDVMVINTSNRPVALPHGTVMGRAREVETNSIMSMDEGWKELARAESLQEAETLQHEAERWDQASPDKELPSREQLGEIVEGITHLSEEEKGKLLDLLFEYRNVFAADPKAPPLANLPPHKIEIKSGSTPPHKPPYRVNPNKVVELMKQVREKEAAGMIQRSNSPFCSPVVLAPKPDGSWRFCVDYRELNKVTVPDRMPLPRIDTILDALGGNVYYSTMDLAAGFYQIGIEEESRPKTAFITPEGLYEWVRMPMGLSNSPATFQRVMNMVLSGLNWITCIVYVDDIICFSETFNTHLERLEEIFLRLTGAGLTLKLKKCNFLAKEVEYLGHVVDATGRRPHPRNLAALKDIPVPAGKHAVTQVQGFVGLCNYYNGFIPAYSVTVEPLIRLTKKGIVFVWGEEQQEAFDTLKSALLSAPLLRHPDFSKRFYVQTDACGYGLGAVLTQEYEDGKHPILYLSRSLSEAERKWAARELEALGVVWAVTKLRPYLEGAEFTVQTDHESLQWLMRTDTPGRLSRWALQLQEFLPQMEIEYRRGVDNGNADYFSRFPVNSLQTLPAKVVEKWEEATREVRVLATLRARLVEFCALSASDPTFVGRGEQMATRACSLMPVEADEVMEEEEESEEGTVWGADLEAEEATRLEPPILNNPLFKLTFEQAVSEEYGKDDKWLSLISYLTQENIEATDLSNYEKEQMIYRSEYFSFEGEKVQLLYLKSFLRKNKFSPRLPHKRLVIPDTMRDFIISSFHDSVTGVHFGTSRVIPAIKQRFYWPNMEREIREYIHTCDLCQRAKATRKRSAGLLKPKGIGRPGFLSVDLQGPFPNGTGNYDFILTLKDVFLGLVVLLPMKSGEKGIDAKHCADLIFRNWVRFFGIPRVILTDRGPQFEAELFGQFCKRLGIDRAKTAAYHPETNSQAERQHGFHTPLLKALCVSNPRDWPNWLPYLQFAINTSPVEGHGVSPLESLTGFPPLQPLDLYLLPVDDFSFDNDRYQYNLEHPKRMRHIHALMNKVKNEQNENMKERYDQTHIEVLYGVGDLCLIYKPANVKGPRKLAIDFRGPFRVTRVMGPNTYKVSLHNNEDTREWTVSVKNMVRYALRGEKGTSSWMDVDPELPRPALPPRFKKPREAILTPVGQVSMSERPPEELAYLELTNSANPSIFIADSGMRGLGVYSRRARTCGAILGEYKAELLTANQHERRYRRKPALYSMELESGRFLDASDFRLASWTRYVNAPGPGEKANAEFVEAKDGKSVTLFALRDLGVGEEILCDYGSSYEWADGLLQGSALAPEIPPLPLNIGDLVDTKEPGGDDSDENNAERAPVAPTAPSGRLLAEDVVENVFLLVQLDKPPPVNLQVAKVVAMDEFREFATVHMYGTYNKDDKKAYRPAYVDPRDNKLVFTYKPKPSLRAFEAQVVDEHVMTDAFQLTKKGDIPFEYAQVKLR